MIITEEFAIERVKRSLKLFFPNGDIWKDKENGGELEKTLDGFAKEFGRIFYKIYNLQYALLPQHTEYLDELDDEFFSANSSLTEQQRRDRLDMRWKLFFESKNRIALMEEVFHVSGYPTVKIRTLGSNGINESPFDFFDTSGLAYWGNEELIWGRDDFIYGQTETGGGALLITNGGSINYYEDGIEALVQLEQDSDYWLMYLIVEDESGDELEIAETLKENFFDLLYLMKPAEMHLIVRASFV